MRTTLNQSLVGQIAMMWPVVLDDPRPQGVLTLCASLVYDLLHVHENGELRGIDLPYSAEACSALSAAIANTVCQAHTERRDEQVLIVLIEKDCQDAGFLQSKESAAA